MRINSLFVLCILSFHIYAQGPEKVQAPPSPTVASLGKFDQINVDYFNGLVNAQVPLYTIRSGSFSIPIQLMYHGQGMKPDQRSGWVGLNWSLNIPWAITRVLNGEPDEKLLSGHTFDIPGYQYPFSASYYNHYGVLDRSDWHSYSALVEYQTKFFNLNNTSWSDKRPVPSPDEFKFNFLGFSGSFLLDHKGFWRFKCDQPGALKVIEVNIFPDVPVSTTPSQLSSMDYAVEITSLQPDGSNPYKTRKKRMIKGFTLADGSGNKYVFGGEEGSIEYSRFPFSFPAEDYWGNLTIPTTYYLTNIIPLKGSEITFEYIKSNRYQFNTTEIWKTLQLNTVGYSSSTNGPGNNVSLNIINGSYLSKIAFEDGYVLFERSFTNDLSNPYTIGGGAYIPFNGYPDIFEQNQMQVNEPQYYKLDAIKVYDSDERYRKHIQFTYDEISTKRLMLKEVKDVSEEVPVRYQFTYYEDPSKPQPPYHSRQLDHWGFWNGINWFQTNANNISMSNYPSYYASREPVFDWAKQGALEKIVYPTGGHSKFTYQLNDYTGLLNYYNGNTSNIFDPNADITYSEIASPAIKNAGGLRIWKVEDFSPETNQTYTKEFEYRLPEENGVQKSSGILAGLPSYIEQGQLWFNTWYYFLSWQNYNTQPFGLTNGSHITYSRVKEKLPSGAYIVRVYSNSNNISYRDQKYLNKAIGNNNVYRGNMPYSSLELERGQLLEELYYNSANILLKKIKYSYNTNPQRQDDHVRMVEFTALDMSTGFADLVSSFRPNTSGSTDYIKIRNAYSYKKYMYPNNISKIEETVWDQNGVNSVYSVTDLEYDQYRNIRSKSTLTSDNKLVKILFKYSGDYPSTGTDVASLGIKLLKESHCNSCVIETITITSNADGSNPVVTDAVLNFYKQDKPLLEKQIRLNKNQIIPYTASFDSYIGNDNQFHFNSFYNNEPVYRGELYNNESKVIQERMKEGITYSYVWYNSTFLSAVCKGAFASDIAFTSFEEKDMFFERGNWYVSGLITDNTVSLTGYKSYPLANGNITKNGLSNSLQYIVTYWSQNASAVVNGTTGTQGVTRNGWTYYEHTISNTTSITISGNSRIDELRLLPKAAQMSTFVFDPVFGMTSQSDPNNVFTFYEYDNLGRLKIIKDHNKNIVKTYCYNYYAGNLVSPCYNGTQGYVNSAQSGWFTKQCPNGEIGTQVLYIVPAGTHTAATFELANQLAQQDVINNGQAYANANGTCLNTTCVTGTGNCNGPDLKCIRGVCEKAKKVMLGYYCDGTFFQVIFRYEWSDGSKSAEFTESAGSCGGGPEF
ncbi:DUF5977 domain-containing protein [Lacibacter sp. MH-610]|uniref:DUF5977 domain-containing protein n=1 Tax=Lacibacter sp. MH-610 TaxID=3020883 RepID=UPI00389267F7